LGALPPDSHMSFGDFEGGEHTCRVIGFLIIFENNIEN